MPLTLAIAGASGRMGRTLIESVLAHDDLVLGAALDAPGSPLLGQDAGAALGRPAGVAITDQLDALSGVDVLIDFTRPAATLAYLEACVARRVRLVIGTTGFDEPGIAAIRAAAGRTAIVFAPNMSVGVNVSFKLIELAARFLGDDYDVEISEAHHRHKVDAPSGTALRMGELVAGQRGRALAEVAVHGRSGATGERPRGAIGFSVVRGGDIVGDHTVLFAGAGERVEITHRAASRANYALGSLRAARFLAGQERGLFDMQDVLGLR